MVSTGLVMTGSDVFVIHGPISILASAMMTTLSMHSSDLVEHQTTPREIYSERKRRKNTLKCPMSLSTQNGVREQIT